MAPWASKRVILNRSHVCSAAPLKKNKKNKLILLQLCSFNLPSTFIFLSDATKIFNSFVFVISSTYGAARGRPLSVRWSITRTMSCYKCYKSKICYKCVSYQIRIDYCSFIDFTHAWLISSFEPIVNHSWITSATAAETVNGPVTSPAALSRAALRSRAVGSPEKPVPVSAAEPRCRSATYLWQPWATVRWVTSPLRLVACKVAATPPPPPARCVGRFCRRDNRRSFLL